MQMTGRNLQKAVVLIGVSSSSNVKFTTCSGLTISLSTGSKLPKYGLSEATEQILTTVRVCDRHEYYTDLGTRNKASIDRISNATSVVLLEPLRRPTILAMKNAMPTSMMARSQMDQKSEP